MALFESEARGHVATSTGDLVVSPLMDGRSGARVFRIKRPGVTSVFVAKIDALEVVQEELRRARAATPPARATPTAFFSLGGTAVLIQHLFTNLDEPLEGAPSLKERLAMRSAWERGRRTYSEPLISELQVGLERLIDMIKEVNATTGQDTEVHCWTNVEPLSHLAELGIRWRIETDTDAFDPVDLLPWVEEKLGELSNACLVHGDLHAGNVLMLDDRTPRLIDFARAGAGHPCFDLVRLSSAISYSSLRPVRNEQRLRQFFHRAHVEGAGPEELASEFPELVAGSGATLAARALSLARAAALEALGENPDKETHYLLPADKRLSGRSVAVGRVVEGWGAGSSVGAVGFRCPW